MHLKNIIAEIKHTVVQTGSVTHPASYPMDSKALLAEVQQPVR
jgi:hypothetical protein